MRNGVAWYALISSHLRERLIEYYLVAYLEGH